MDKAYRRGLVIFISLLIIAGTVGYIIGRAHTGISSRTGDNSAEQRAIVTELGAEQSIVIGEFRYSRAELERSLDVLDEIRGITASANIAYRELREFNRQSGDIYAAIEQELALLESYFGRVSGVVGDFDNYADGE